MLFFFYTSFPIEKLFFKRKEFLNENVGDERTLICKKCEQCPHINFIKFTNHIY